MEWLKDKKNLPIVIAIGAVALVAIGLCLYFFVFSSSGDTTQQTAQVDTTGATPGMPPGGAAPTPGGPAAAPPASAPAAPAAAPPTAAGATPAATAPATPGAPGAKGAQVASIKPMETYRSDPFEPIGYKKPVKVKITPPIWDFPFERMPLPRGVSVGTGGKKRVRPEIQQPARRMAGILLNERVYAIIEANGASQVVQPGDYTMPDRLAIVERIEPDRVVLKTVDETPRYITVKMAASPITQAPVAVAPPSQGPPGMPPMPRMPRGNRGMPPPPPSGGMP